LKRLRIPGVVDILEVSEPSEIKALAHDPRLDRKFLLRTCLVNWLLLKRSLIVLSFNGRRFPTMTPRDSAPRQNDQQKLANSLNERAAAIREGSEELEPIARWIRGIGPESQAGMLAQQLLGRLFSPQFVATEESWTAAEVLATAPRSWKMPMILWWFTSGKVKRSRRLLAQMVDGDLSALNAIGIAVHNLVKSVRAMRLLYADRVIRSSLSPEVAARKCVFAPASVYRQATDAGELGGCPFSRNSLFVFEIGKASRQEAGLPLAFMDGTWSRCPAAEWAPAMLEGVWRRATIKLPNAGGTPRSPLGIG
jgi:hypothetical protein